MLINRPNLTYATRGQAVINDVTLEDAHFVGLNKVCKITDNGNDAPSTLLDRCSNTFIQEYQSSDLIISKGQGNFEGLMHQKHPNTFFMLIAKCQPIAELLKVPVKELLITKY